MHTARVLSHRLRGFSGPEGSLSNLLSAIEQGVKLIEIDTRHTSDGEIVVQHSPCLATLTNRKGLVCQAMWTDVARARFTDKPDEGPCRLADFLEVVAEHREVELWVDIKDYGLEKQYVRAIDHYGLTGRARIISWMPQTVSRIASLGPKISIGLSYSCSARHPLVHRMLRRAAILLRKQSRPLLPGRHGRFADLCAVIPTFHPIPEHLLSSMPMTWAHGYNHSHIIPGLPGGAIGEILSRRGGAVGMFPKQATAHVVGHAHRQGMTVYVYCVDDEDYLDGYVAKSHVDVVFSNNADLVRRKPVVAVE